MIKGLARLDSYELVDLGEIAARLRVSPAVMNNITYDPNTTFPRPQDGRGKCRMWVWYEVFDWYMAHRIVKGPQGSHIPKLENRYRNQNRAYRRVG